MHLVLWLADGIDDRRVAEAALAAGVAARPVSPTYSSDRRRPGLILGLGDFEAERMEAAVRQLTAIIGSMVPNERRHGVRATELETVADADARRVLRPGTS